jgi:hypothetical protein
MTAAEPGSMELSEAGKNACSILSRTSAQRLALARLLPGYGQPRASSPTLGSCCSSTKSSELSGPRKAARRWMVQLAFHGAVGPPIAMGKKEFVKWYSY